MSGAACWAAALSANDYRVRLLRVALRAKVFERPEAAPTRQEIPCSVIAVPVTRELSPELLDVRRRQVKGSVLA